MIWGQVTMFQRKLGSMFDAVTSIVEAAFPLVASVTMVVAVILAFVGYIVFMFG